MKKSVKLDASRLLGLRLEHAAKSGAKLGDKQGAKLGDKALRGKLGAKLGDKFKPARKA